MTKVQLESHDDLQYLLQEFKYATNQSLQHHGNTLSAAAYQEVKKRLNKWVETIFELAGENVEINGLPYTSDLPHQTGSKSYCINIPEYEPLDESLRSEIDSLQCEIQDLVVSVTQTRKSIPTSVHKILTNTVSQTTQMIEESVIHIDDTVDDAVVIEDFNIADYQDLCFKQSDLVSKIPVVQARVNQVESLLEELDIPSSSANKPHDRRKSSIGLIPKSVTPRKATVELLKRLQS